MPTWHLIRRVSARLLPATSLSCLGSLRSTEEQPSKSEGLRGGLSAARRGWLVDTNVHVRRRLVVVRPRLEKSSKTWAPCGASIISRLSLRLFLAYLPLSRAAGVTWAARLARHQSGRCAAALPPVARPLPTHSGKQRRAPGTPRRQKQIRCDFRIYRIRASNELPRRILDAF